MARYSIAALILTYNETMMTTDLCRRLIEQGEVLDIVVVDNSEDKGVLAENAKAIPAISDKVTYIKSPTNGGYAAGNNIGVDHILKNTGADYIWIINNDIIPQDNAALAMVETLQQYNNKAVCGSVLLYYDQSKIVDDSARIQCYGGGTYYPFIGKSKLYLKNLNLNRLKEEPIREVDFIMGASMMVHRDIFKDIGLIPEEYFMYLEELDWQTLAKKANYKLVVAQSSLIFHLDSLSFENKRHGFYYYINRASVMFTRKYYKLFLPGVLLFRALEAIMLVPGKKNKLYSLKGLRDGLRFKFATR